VARRSARPPAIEEEEEPTTSFKTALIVMVLLHVVFFGGIYMFEQIKTHRPVAPIVKKTAPAPVAAASPAVSPAAAPALPAGQRVKPQPALAEAPKKPVAAPAPVAPAEPKDSGQVYTVAKGDTPVSIARKLHVAYDDLLKLNKIENPKSLRIGVKLHVPAKPRVSTN
jgi:LysM repeat protein